MKELFKKQLESNSVVTEEILDKLNIKNYKNGDEIKVGDNVLYALLTDMSEEMIKAKSKSMGISKEPQEILLELITLNENQFDLYTYDERFQDKTNENKIPIIRIKQ